MVIENIENIVTLFSTIIGLLGCLFQYLKLPKRSCLYLIIFFLAHFLSDYYWGIYVLVMNSYPEVSEFAAYLGWNISYLFLFLAIFQIGRERGKREFHPLMLWPVLTNIPQLLLYIQFGGIFNNIWQVTFTTLIMIFSTGELLYYRKHKSEGIPFPAFPLLLLIYEIVGYIMWTSSCFEWPGELADPYLYCTFAGAVLTVFFAWAISRDYKEEAKLFQQGSKIDLRFQTAIQTVLTLVISTVCMGGYFLIRWIRSNFSSDEGGAWTTNGVVLLLFLISAVLVLFILFLVYKITAYYRISAQKPEKKTGNRSRFNLIFTVIATLVLMVVIVLYNTKSYYDVSVTGILEEGENKVSTVAAELDNYLNTAETTIRVVADTVDLMERNGESSERILRYLTDQTEKQFEQFDENFTGLYAYANGQYMDGSGWVPPEGYDATQRDWYKAIVAAEGELIIVKPYVDAQSGSVVITIGKMVSNSKEDPEGKSPNVVCLDVILNHVKEVTQEVDVAGKGYGMVVTSEGFVIAHRDERYNGESVLDIHAPDLMDRIREVNRGSFHTVIDGQRCTVFVCPILEQWYDVIVVNDTELFEDVYLQLGVNITVSLITFLLITFFYYLGYKNEQAYGQIVEEMNLHVVGALAAAIDAKDTYTNGHSSRVAKYSKMIAERFGCSEGKQDEIYMMGLLHDVGKIGVPDEVINKTSRLTDEEFELIKKHPVIGSKILQSIKERPELSIGARWHHERYAGGGYPDGIKGEEIPEEARIIAVADAYDAMTSRRSYRDVIPQEKVRSEIEKGKGTQFDPRFAEIMLQIMDEDMDYILREFPEQGEEGNL